jgi:threonine synthase
MDDKRENQKSFESNPRESATSLNSKKELNLKKRELNYLIGNSTFIEARNLANDLGIERRFLKFEGSNPTGTQKEDGVLNANPEQSVVKEISLNAYGDISLEIFRSLRKSPDYVFCPVGNGTTLAGIYKGFKVLLEKGQISTIDTLSNCKEGILL